MPLNEEDIFKVASKIPFLQARNDYLKQVCGHDKALFDRVGVLLRMREEDPEFLELPLPALAATLDTPPIAEKLGSMIGPYKLLERIGEGGFGVVFMAEQHQPVRRKVALKVLKPGMDTRQVVARFEAERQALALMDHPNIAHVFDGGETTSGRPYFVMELVRGIPVTDFCDQNHLSVRERLALFVNVCQAVQHAHHKGVIHRDLKPTNIMVTMHDATPVVKVIDFGIAKATGQQLTEKTLFTNFAQMIGTPMYMSPEQAQMSGLDMDTRTDIYSLGVLLYELLTGTTPFDKERLGTAAYDEIRRMIVEEEPAKPSTRISDMSRPYTQRADSVTRSATSTLAAISANRGSDPKALSRLFRGELDWIVMKALEKDRNRRYETASAFGADVQHYLHDEPVQACPPSVGYRLRKLARRHRGPVLAASLVALALVIGIIGTTWGMIRATDAEADAVTEAGHKEIALREKEFALAAAQQSKRDGDLELFGSYLIQARANRLSGHAGRRFDSLEVLKRATDLARALDLPAARFDELRNATIASLALPDLHLAGPWNRAPADMWSMDFDAAHVINARTDRQGNCTVRRVADDVELHRLPGLGLGEAAVPHLSRDGKFICVVYARQLGRAWKGVAVELWALDETDPRKIRLENNVHSIDFHRNGQKVALVYNDGAISLFELPSGQQLGPTLPPDTLTREVEIALHPTEPLVAVCSYFNRVVQIRDVRTGEVVASLPQSTGTTHTAWHPDGQTLAVAAADGGLVRLYDRITLQPYRTLEVAGSDGLRIAFNHAGDRLAVAGWSAAMELYDIGTGRKLLKTVPVVGPRRFSLDDQYLAGALQDGKIGIWQVGDGRECRTLVHPALPDKLNSGFMSLSPHRDGRLLAAGMTDGLGLWDLATGNELAFVPMNGELQGVHAVHFEPSGDLLTASASGVLRWPVRVDPLTARPDTGVRSILVGPPQTLLPRAVNVKQSRDAKVLVACCSAVGVWQPHAGAWIMHADRPDEPIRIEPGEDIVNVAVSPNGKWVVTATLAGQAKVWHAADGKFEKKLADFGAIHPRFSPDSRWLCTYGGGGRLFDVNTWEATETAWGAFAPDSNLMAIQPTTGVIRLVERATGREFARLEDPDFETLSHHFFSADGSQLIGCTFGKVKAIRVWDLRLIRKQLKAMGLDWEWPEFSPANHATRSAAQPLKVRVLSGDLVQTALTREQKARQAIDQYRRAVEANPEDSRACNNLAWFYLTAPESMRDVEAALPLAENAVRPAPDNPVYRNTLGLAYYRAGRYREAVDILRPHLQTQEGWALAFDLYFLAMSHHGLGENARAQEYYDLAMRWPQTQPGLSAEHIEELTWIRAEAEELLKGTGRKTDPQSSESREQN
jgi:serine/threonine protein kinase/WD40 repeat protein